MKIDWDTELIAYIEDGESYYDCLKRLIDECGTQQRVADMLKIDVRSISNLFYSVEHQTQNGNQSKAVVNHTKRFLDSIHRGLISKGVNITREGLISFLKSSEGQEFIRAKITLGV